MYGISLSRDFLNSRLTVTSFCHSCCVINNLHTDNCFGYQLSCKAVRSITTKVVKPNISLFHADTCWCVRIYPFDFHVYRCETIEGFGWKHVMGVRVCISACHMPQRDCSCIQFLHEQPQRIIASFQFLCRSSFVPHQLCTPAVLIPFLALHIIARKLDASLSEERTEDRPLSFVLVVLHLI